MTTIRPRSAGSRFQRSAAYSRYAEVYDAIGQREFGERIAEATLDYLRESAKHVHSVVDLACGTGAASLMFAATGVRVTGIDRSSEMLKAARHAAEIAGCSIEWILEDIRSFQVDCPVDLITCFYDGVNYLTEPRDVLELFECVYQSLVPGGLFAFDVNTRKKFGSGWDGACFVAVDREDLYGVYQSWFQADTGISPLILTFFVRTPGGEWQRFDEEHIERAYPLDEISAMLETAGLSVRDIRDYADRFPRFGGPGSERSDRVVFIAERPGTQP